MFKPLNEKGMVSIIISTVVMTILTLIVLSFAGIMRREQEQALDRQLNTQAFYAAESAVNDVRQALFNGSLVNNIDSCDDTNDVSDTAVNSASSISSEISCVTVDLSPEEIVFDSISTDRSQIVDLESVDSTGTPVAISSIRINFNDPDGDENFRSSYEGLPSLGGWGDGPGVLFVEAIPVPSGNFDRATLRTLNRAFYLYPRDNSVGLTKSWGNDAVPNDTVDVVQTNCDSSVTRSRACEVTLIGLPAGMRGYTLRLMSVYQPVSATITALDAGGNPVSFVNTQAVVDATGRSNDVLRRIREVIPLTSSYDYPEFGIDAGDICKRIQAENTEVDIETSVASIDACSL